MLYPLPLDETKRLKLLRSLEILDTGAEKEPDHLTRLAVRICQVPISVISLVKFSIVVPQEISREQIRKNTK